MTAARVGDVEIVIQPAPLAPMGVPKVAEQPKIAQNSRLNPAYQNPALWNHLAPSE